MLIFKSHVIVIIIIIIMKVKGNYIFLNIDAFANIEIWN